MHLSPGQRCAGRLADLDVDTCCRLQPALQILKATPLVFRQAILSARDANIDLDYVSLCLANISLTWFKFKYSLVIMISKFLRIASCALFLTCSHSTPTSIYDSEAFRPSRHEEEFIDGEIHCTGHTLEDNFEDNLASAAASKYDRPFFTNPQSFDGMAVLP